VDGDDAEQGARATLFAAVLRRFIGDDRTVRAHLRETPTTPGTVGPMTGPMGMSKGRMEGGPPFGPGMGYLHQPGVSLTAQVQLRDGAFVTVETRQPIQTASWPYRMIWSIAILLTAAVVVALIAVRWATRHCRRCTAAGELAQREPAADTGDRPHRSRPRRTRIQHDAKPACGSSEQPHSLARRDVA
jgi:hypothetical protein